MSFKSSLLMFLIMCFASSVGSAQNPPAMGATAGLGPGDTFTLFVTFKDPMPEIGSINCVFRLTTDRKPGQETFGGEVDCIGAGLKKDDDTHYRVQVGIPKVGIADGDYRLTHIGIGIGDASRQYEGNNIPNPPTVSITNHEHLKFSDLKSVEVKK